MAVFRLLEFAQIAAGQHKRSPASCSIEELYCDNQFARINGHGAIYRDFLFLRVKHGLSQHGAFFWEFVNKFANDLLMRSSADGCHEIREGLVCINELELPVDQFEQGGWHKVDYRIAVNNQGTVVQKVHGPYRIVVFLEF